MAANYTLKYRTFDELMADVTDDLEAYEDQGLIDPSKLIKVVASVNSELGLKIHQEKEALIEVENFKANLPNDFQILNFALLCYKTITTSIGPLTHTENKEIDLCTTPEVNLCECETIHKGSCGRRYKVVLKVKKEVSEFTELDLVKLVNTSRKNVNDGCFNVGSGSMNEVQIKGDYVYTNFRTGALYINYIGSLIDDEGNLLVLDHPLINEYYEYAVKRRVIENMFLNKDMDVRTRLELLDARLYDARKKALLIKNMPEYSEIQEVFMQNRARFYNKYYKMFEY